MNQTYNFTYINESLSKIDYIGSNTFNYSDWDLIQNYCTNLNQHLIKIIMIMFVIYVMIDILKYLYKKTDHQLILKGYHALKEGWFNAHWIFYVYFVYIYISQINTGFMEYIFQYRYYIILLVVLFALHSISKRFIKFNVFLFTIRLFRKIFNREKP